MILSRLTFSLMFLLASVVAFAAPASKEIVTKENAAETIWTTEVPAVAKGGPSAHDPKYDNRDFWPHLDGKEYFKAQEWPAGRLLTWAHPGQRGVVKNPRPNELVVTEPANWLEEGKPATKLWDEDTDILLPAWTSAYEVNMRDCPVRQVFRHITVEANALLIGGGDGQGRLIHGNVWIKRGGMLSAQGATQFLGHNHTFLRNDNTPVYDPGPSLWAKPNEHCYMLSQYFVFVKNPATVSVEVMGQVIVLDEFRIDNCTVIVSRNSMLQPGRNASPEINNGVLVLLDGAYFGVWANEWQIPDLAGKGTIQGGLPERPLTRSATFALNFKNNSNAQYNGGKKDPEMPGWYVTPPEWAGYARVPSLLLKDGSSIKSYTTDPTKALLTFSPITPEADSTIGPPPGTPPRVREPNERNSQASIDALNRIYAWYQSLPRGIDIYLGKSTTVDGVCFDNIRPGGLLMPDPVEAQNWKNVSFSPATQASGEELYTKVEKLNRGKY